MIKTSAGALDEVFDEVTALAALLHHSGNGEAKGLDLSLSQRGVLRRLQASPGLTVPQLAREQGKSRQSMQVVVNRLAALDLVRYVANPDHQRSQQMLLTSAGRRSLNSANHRQLAWMTELALTVSDAELQLCLSVLERLRVRLGGRKRVPSRRTRARLKPPSGVQPPTNPPLAPRPLRGLPEETMEDSLADELPVNLL